MKLLIFHKYKVSVSFCLFISNEYFFFYFQSGNKYLLSSDRVWKNLIYHYARLGCVVEDYEEFPRSSSNHKVPGGLMYLQSKTASNSKKYSDNRVPKRKTIKHQLTKETEEDFYRGTDQEEEMHQRRLQKEELLYSRD